MQVDSIISNTISQDIRLKGHQSIRLAPDGFSVLISDASYAPVFLKHYSYPELLPHAELYAESARILDENSLLSFEGETVLILDSLSATLVPKYFYHQEHGRNMLDILIIKEDRLLLLNRYTLNDPSDFIYHVMNSMKQLGLDRESIPVYLSGIIHDNHELYGLLGKYVRNVLNTPYYLEELSRENILRFMILSEGSKCA